MIKVSTNIKHLTNDELSTWVLSYVENEKNPKFNSDEYKEIILLLSGRLEKVMYDLEFYNNCDYIVNKLKERGE